jgi:putative addiction module component (TIGR02574 family)
VLSIAAVYNTEIATNIEIDWSFANAQIAWPHLSSNCRGAALARPLIVASRTPGDKVDCMKPIRLADVLELPVPERLKLVEAIWDSIAEIPEAIALSESQRAELERRFEDYEKNPDAGSPWPEVRARIVQRD